MADDGPDLSQVVVYCSCNSTNPLRMTCISNEAAWGVHIAKAIYQCTVCRRKKKVEWSWRSREMYINDMK